jgi:hypothetical protein
MSNTRRLGLAVTQIALFSGVILVATNYQLILDQYALATYKPSAKVASIESNISLTNYSRALLYRANPRVDTKTQFNHDCQTKPGDLELGCYYRNQIYILEIDNPSLSPEMDVVTAHEMLHAGWDRLGSKEKMQLANDLESVYASINDPELKDRMVGYAKSEPGEQTNELHSILATERSVLTPSLENYYSRYFSNRQTVVSAHAKYTAIFESQRKSLEDELAAIRSQKAQLTVLNNQMDNYKSSSRISQYNSLVAKQNDLVDRINARIEAYQKGVDEYNALSLVLDSRQITETESGVK